MIILETLKKHLNHKKIGSGLIKIKPEVKVGNQKKGEGEYIKN